MLTQLVQLVVMMMIMVVTLHIQFGHGQLEDQSLLQKIFFNQVAIIHGNNVEQKCYSH